jgi:hypothetical protein
MVWKPITSQFQGRETEGTGPGCQLRIDRQTTTVREHDFMLPHCASWSIRTSSVVTDQHT